MLDFEAVFAHSVVTHLGQLCRGQQDDTAGMSPFQIPLQCEHGSAPRVNSGRPVASRTPKQASLSVLVIDENSIRASIIEVGLREAGYDNVTIVDDMNGLARRIMEINPDVIVIDIENPNRDMLESIFQISRAVKRPIAMFVDKSDEDSIVAAVDAGVSAYVVDGLKKERVKPILEMAVSRFNAFSRLQRELAEARSALEERKVIDRAKGILMKMRGLSEEEAFALLRQTAMNEKKKIAEIAQSVVTAAGLLM